MNCGKRVVFIEDLEGRLPGHIYSRSGVDEFKISRCCEFCFDKLMKEPEETKETNG